LQRLGVFQQPENSLLKECDLLVDH
jgi:hypothetical protein